VLRCGFVAALRVIYDHTAIAVRCGCAAVRIRNIAAASRDAVRNLKPWIGSLLTYEIAINERTDKKTKSMAFVTNAEDEDAQGYLDTEESIIDALVLLGRQLNKVMKRVDGRQKLDGQNI
jgi:hypothetical protein